MIKVVVDIIGKKGIKSKKMDDLIVENQNRNFYLPKIEANFKKGVIKISGEMADYEKKTKEHLSPLLEKLKEYFKSPLPETLFIWELNYYNTGCLIITKEILKTLESYQKKTSTIIKVRWYYQTYEYEIDPLEDPTKQDGEALMEITSLVFEVLPRK